MKIIASIKHSEISKKILEAGLIAFTLILPFGLQINRLGLYGDDWANVLFPKANNSFSGLDGLTRAALIQIAGSQPFLYHLVTLLILFVIGILFKNILIQMGLDHVSATACAMLFLLYPGFLQPISGIVISGILIGLVFALLSFLFFQKWLESSGQKISFLIVGLICSFFCIFYSPFSAVLSCFTFLFLIPCWRKSQTRNKINLVLIGAGLFLAGIISVLLQSQAKLSFHTSVLSRIGRIWLDAFIVCWRQVLAIPQHGSETLIYLLVLLFAGFTLFWIFKMIERAEGISEKDSNHEITSGEFVILISSALVGFGYILLIIIVGLPLEIQYPNDLGMLVLGVLASIFAVLGIKAVFLSKYRLAVLAILIVLAGGARFSLIGRYAVENSSVKDLLAQMAVRADYLQSGSLLISEQLPFDYTTQKAIDALIKKQFNVETQDGSVTYISADQSELREFLHEGSRKETKLRIDNIDRFVSKDNIIGFWVKQGSCMQVLNEKYLLSDLPEGLKLVLPLSKPELFKSNMLSDVKQLNQFRNKIVNDWCFYFQLANRQAADGKWKDVLQTYINAEEEGFTPQSFYDFFPLLTALIQENLFPRAIEISNEFIASQEQKIIICNLWKDRQTEADLTEEAISGIKQARTDVGCL
jgi:hypothetical protein